MRWKAGSGPGAVPHHVVARSGAADPCGRPRAADGPPEGVRPAHEWLIPIDPSRPWREATVIRARTLVLFRTLAPSPRLTGSAMTTGPRAAPSEHSAQETAGTPVS